MKQLTKFALTSISVALLSACGGGGDSAPESGATTTSLSGVVADGYLRGATVCLDINQNAVCDSDEPTAVTGQGGAYTMTDIPSGVESTASLLVEVPATAVDEDNPDVAVGQAYFLSAPAGQHAFISPLTTMLHQQMQNESQTKDEAMSALQSQLKLNIDLTQNYIEMKQSTTDEDQVEYEAAHSTAQAVVRTLQQNLTTLGEVAPAQKSAVMSRLVTMAQQAAASQGGDVKPDLTFGVESPNTLKASIASATNDAASATQDIRIAFDLVHNEDSIRCGDPISLTNVDSQVDPTVPQDTTGQLIDARFFVSNVLVTKADGSVTPVYLAQNDNQYQDVALLDFGYNTASSGVACTATYNMEITGKVAPGDYTGATMTVGVPIRSADLETKLNHTDRTFDSERAAITTSGMNWSWQGGRKFIKLEFMPDEPIDKPDSSTTPKWNVHIGSTGCVGDPTIAGNETACTNPNRLDLNFSEFDASNQKIVLDVARLFAKSDVTYEAGGAVGCMSSVSDPECPAIFETLGISLTDGQTLTGEDQQSVFSVRNKN